MFVRVMDKKRNHYYKSIVYAIAGIGWFTQYIVLNPTEKTFELVDCCDKSTVPAKPFVEIIQFSDSDFKIYKGSDLLKYKYFCKTNHIEFVDMKIIRGFPDVCENYDFLADILTNKSVPMDAYKISIRNLPDAADWKYILTQSDADDFMKQFVGFHDATLEKITYFESYNSTSAIATFDNSVWFGVAELCFEGIQIMKILPAMENCSRVLFEASLIVENESIFWADSYMEKTDLTYNGNMIQALSLKWRKA